MTSRKDKSVPLALDISILVTRNFRTKRPEILFVLPKPEKLLPEPVHCLPTTEFAPGTYRARHRCFVGEPNVEGILCDHDVNQAASRLAATLGLETDPKRWKNQYFHSDLYRDKRHDKRRISLVLRHDLEIMPELDTPDNLQVRPRFYPLLKVVSDHLGFDHGAYIELLRKEWELNNAIWQQNPDGTYVHFCANMLAVQAQAKLKPEDGGFPNFVRPVEQIVWDPEGYPVIWLRIGLDHDGLVCLPGAVKNCPYCSEDLSFGPLE